MPVYSFSVKLPRSILMARFSASRANPSKAAWSALIEECLLSDYLPKEASLLNWAIADMSSEQWLCEGAYWVR